MDHERRLSREDAIEKLHEWNHPRPARWLRAKLESGAIGTSGDPPRIRLGDLWRALLADECDKLYNQAWCALDRLREEGDDAGMLLAIDDLPTAVEQAVSLAPDLSRELLDLLGEHRPERLENLRRELGIGTARERAERIECLAFWERNGEDLSPLRRTLFRLVREALEEEDPRRDGETP